MTNEAMKALLMILMIGSLLGAIQMPKIWASRHSAIGPWQNGGKTMMKQFLLVLTIGLLDLGRIYEDASIDL